MLLTLPWYFIIYYLNPFRFYPEFKNYKITEFSQRSHIFLEVETDFYFKKHKFTVVRDMAIVFIPGPQRTILQVCVKECHSMRSKIHSP